MPGSLYTSQIEAEHAKQVPTYQFNHNNLPNDEQTLLLNDQVQTQHTDISFDEMNEINE